MFLKEKLSGFSNRSWLSLEFQVTIFLKTNENTEMKWGKVKITNIKIINFRKLYVWFNIIRNIERVTYLVNKEQNSRPLIPQIIEILISH